jgi:hypothetical protein
MRLGLVYMCWNLGYICANERISWLASFKKMLPATDRLLHFHSLTQNVCQDKHQNLVPLPLQTLCNFGIFYSTGRRSSQWWEGEREKWQRADFFFLNDETDCAAVWLAHASTNGRPSSMATGSVTKTTFCRTPFLPHTHTHTHTPLFLGYITLLPSSITWLCAFKEFSSHSNTQREIKTSRFRTLVYVQIRVSPDIWQAAF